MKKIKAKIEIIIDKIIVDEGAYGIHYKYSSDGKSWESGAYGSDFEGHSIKEWKEILMKSEAVAIIMQRIADNL